MWKNIKEGFGWGLGGSIGWTLGEWLAKWIKRSLAAILSVSLIMCAGHGHDVAKKINQKAALHSQKVSVK